MLSGEMIGEALVPCARQQEVERLHLHLPNRYHQIAIFERKYRHTEIPRHHLFGIHVRFPVRFNPMVASEFFFYIYINVELYGRSFEL